MTLSGFAAGLAFMACSIGAPSPIPFDGPAPQRIAVLPVRSAVVPPDDARVLGATVGAALRDRGYVVIPEQVVAAELERRGGSSDPAGWQRLRAVARDLGADGLLSVRVEVWDTAWRPRLERLAYDLGYRVWDVATGEVVWELRSQDAWSWEPEVVVFESSLESFVGESPPRGRSPFGDVTELARALHRRALDRLPAARS